MEYPDLLKNLQAARVARGMLQTEAAEKLGITQGMLSRYERGEARVTTTMLLKWGQVVGVDVQFQVTPTQMAA